LHEVPPQQGCPRVPHAHVPPTHTWNGPHAGAPPHVQAPLVQPSAIDGSQATHAPEEPHADVVVPATHLPFAQQPVLHGCIALQLPSGGTHVPRALPGGATQVALLQQSASTVQGPLVATQASWEQT
jgi:hypothetical protein